MTPLTTKDGLIIAIAVRTTETEGRAKGMIKTVIYHQGGQHMATFPAGHPQPKYGQKKTNINCWPWALVWIKQ